MLKLVMLSCVLAAVYGSVLGVAPLAYSAPYAYGASLTYGAPLSYSASLGNYRGPLSLAPGQPASILAADGRPLDTLDVNLDRSAHLVAKALNGGVHLLKKRSVISPVASRVALAHAPLFAPVSSLAYSGIAPISHIAPYTSYATPYATYW